MYEVGNGLPREGCRGGLLRALLLLIVCSQLTQHGSVHSQAMHAWSACEFCIGQLWICHRVMYENIVQRCAAMRCCLTAVRRYALLFDIGSAVIFASTSMMTAVRRYTLLFDSGPPLCVVACHLSSAREH